MSRSCWAGAVAGSDCVCPVGRRDSTVAVVEGGGGGGPGGAVAPTNFENPLLGIFHWVCTE